MDETTLTLEEIVTIREWIDGFMYDSSKEHPLHQGLISKLYDYLGDREEELRPI